MALDSRLRGNDEIGCSGVIPAQAGIHYFFIVSDNPNLLRSYALFN
jgi:hypothetical protein